jgi:hypothetical protein
MLKYQIIEVYPESHAIVVRFYTDAITPDMLCTQRAEDGAILRCRTDFSIDLPVPAPEGDALQSFICARAPKAWLETQEAVANPEVDTSLSGIIGLVGLEHDYAASAPVVPVTLSIPAHQVQA